MASSIRKVSKLNMRARRWASTAGEKIKGRKRHIVVDNGGHLLHIAKKIADVFAVLPKRWIVERTFAWLGNFRRLAKDFEILTRTAENIIRIAMIKVSLGTCF